MSDEYNALIKNNTWTLVPRHADTNIVRCMWLFCHKYLAYDTLSRYKARLVANGITQIEGIDVDETFSPVVKLGTIQTVLSSATSRHWLVHQLDAKNVFLHGDLAEAVYVHQPSGFRDSVHPDYVCFLQRSLYGLIQAPRAWYQHFAAYITRFGFSHSRCDSSLFIYRQGTDTAYLSLYVDDIVLTASSEILSQRIIASLHQEFFMTDLVQQVCLYMHDPREPHFSALKRILRYVRGTLDYGLQLFSSSTTSLVAYSDVDWAGCPTTRRSTCGYLQRQSIVVLLMLLLRPVDWGIYYDLVAAAQVRVLHVPSRYQYADIFIKGLSSALFREFRTSLSVRCPPAQTAGKC
ncbi:ribonuclease H-like domain-containing protein [Tanacetum coccineum]